MHDITFGIAGAIFGRPGMVGRPDWPLAVVFVYSLPCIISAFHTDFGITAVGGRFRSPHALLAVISVSRGLKRSSPPCLVLPPAGF